MRGSEIFEAGPVSAPAKRIFDVIFALLCLPAALALSVIAALAIIAEMHAHPLFRQCRVGKDGRQFTIMKLRTMRPDTPDGASHDVGQATVTPVGRLLRRTKMDELPQLWNVLMGDMSLIGPRPCLPSQLELIEARRRLGVLALRPGITGLAQIAGLDMSQPAALAAADAAYLRRWSILADLAILARTAVGAGRGDAAAR